MAIIDVRKSLYAYLLNKVQLFTDIKPDQLAVPNWYATNLEIVDIAVIPERVKLPGANVNSASFDKIIFSVGIGGIRIDIKGLRCCIALENTPNDLGNILEESTQDLLASIYDGDLCNAQNEPEAGVEDTSGYWGGDSRGLYGKLTELALSQIQVCVDVAYVDCILPSGTVLKWDLRDILASSSKCTFGSISVWRALTGADGRTRSRRPSRDHGFEQSFIGMNEGVSLLLSSDVIQVESLTIDMLPAYTGIDISAKAADLFVLPLVESLGELLNHFVFDAKPGKPESHSGKTDISVKVVECTLLNNHPKYGTGKVKTSLSYINGILELGEMTAGEIIVPSPSAVMDFGEVFCMSLSNPLSLDLTPNQLCSVINLLSNLGPAIEMWNLPEPSEPAKFSLQLPEIKIAVSGHFSLLIFPEQFENNVLCIREIIAIAGSDKIILEDLTMSFPSYPESWCFTIKKALVNLGLDFFSAYKWLNDVVVPAFGDRGNDTDKSSSDSAVSKILINFPSIEYSVLGLVYGDLDLSLIFDGRWHGKSKTKMNYGLHFLKFETRIVSNPGEPTVVSLLQLCAHVDIPTAFILKSWPQMPLDYSQQARQPDTRNPPFFRGVVFQLSGILELEDELVYCLTLDAEAQFHENLEARLVKDSSLTIKDHGNINIARISQMNLQYNAVESLLEVAVRELNFEACADSLAHIVTVIAKLVPQPEPAEFQLEPAGLLDVFAEIEDPMPNLREFKVAQNTRARQVPEDVDSFVRHRFSQYDSTTPEHLKPDNALILPLENYFHEATGDSRPKIKQGAGFTVNLTIAKLNAALFDGYDLTKTQNAVLQAIEMAVEQVPARNSQLYGSIYVSSENQNGNRESLLQQVAGDLGCTNGVSRSNLPKVLLRAGGVNFRHSVESEARTGEPATRSEVSVAKLSIRDGNAKSPFSHLLTTLTSEKRAEKRVVSISHSTIEGAHREHRIFAEFSPLRVSIYGGTLDFLTRFFQFSLDVEEEGLPVATRSQSKDSGHNPGFIQRLEILRLPVIIDYVPQPFSLTGLRNGNLKETMNLLSFERAKLVLKHAVLRGVSGVDSVVKSLLAVWTPEIMSRQLLTLLSGFGPWRRLQNVGSQITLGHDQGAGSVPGQGELEMSASVLHIKRPDGRARPARRPKPS